MRRPSREKKREQRHSASSAAPAAVPIDVRVRAAGPGAGTASIGGVSVAAAYGEEIQDAVLRHLHRIARATGHPVHATVHDERIGYVVPLQVCVDGASRYASEPVRVGEPWGAPVSVAEGPVGAAVAPAVVAERPSEIPVPAASSAAPQSPRRDKSTHVLRAVPESAAPAMSERAVEPDAAPAQRAAHGVRYEYEVRPVPSPAVERSASAGVALPGPAPVMPPAPEAAPRAVPVASEAAYVPDQLGGPEPVDPAVQPRREPSTLRLSAAKPAATSESVAPAAPERPKREPRTMPLTAAKPAESVPAVGGVPPSTFVLRRVPEPKDGPLAQPPRTPDLPLTLPGIPVPPDNTPLTPESAHGEAPFESPVAPVEPEAAQDAPSFTGTVAPPTGVFGPVTEPTPSLELSSPPAQSPPSAWQPSRATAQTPSRDTPNTSAPGPISLEPRPWPPNQPSTPVQVPARPRDAVPPSAPKPISSEPQSWPPAAPPTPLPASMPAVTPTPIHEANPEAAPTSPQPADAPPALAPPEESASDPYSAPEWNMAAEDPGPKPAPVREFDSVAEAVLDPEETDGGAPSPFAEPMSRINEAVKAGRIQEAAEMAEQTVAQATAALGPQHPEVLRLRELTAYIAYLASDALRSFHLSLDLARLRHHLRDPRAAYGNIQSAAAAWRAVRDPLQGLHLGRDLIDVWTELAAEAGPAADDLEQLEKARTRMGRLVERARALDAAPYARSPHAHGQ